MANSHETQIALRFRHLIREDIITDNRAGMLCILTNILYTLVNHGIEMVEEREFDDRCVDEVTVHPSLPGWEMRVVVSNLGIIEGPFEVRFHGVLMAQSVSPFHEGWHVRHYVNSQERPEIGCVWGGNEDDSTT